MSTLLKPANPGSLEAYKEGCSCPPTVNQHGLGCGLSDRSGNPLFQVEPECPIHGWKHKTRAANQ